MQLTDEFILEDIIKTWKRLFNVKVLDVIPINRGWLNLKWKVTTDLGDFLVKQYNKERLKKYNRKELLQAYNQQVRLYKVGIPCPNINTYKNHFMFKTDLGEIFIVMDYCAGEIISPGCLKAEQMRDLGKITAKMHQALNDGTLPSKAQPEFIPPSREQRLTYWKDLHKRASLNNRTFLLPIIEQQYKVTKGVDTKEYNLTDAGWAHRDLWVDNILFTKRSVSAILDFDRLKYDYPQLDVARAIMSGALKDDKLDVGLVQGFVQGYKELYPKFNFIKALRLLWYMESTWWITLDTEEFSGPPVRFFEEMNWLSENYNELDSLLKTV